MRTAVMMGRTTDAWPRLYARIAGGLTSDDDDQVPNYLFPYIVGPASALGELSLSLGSS